MNQVTAMLMLDNFTATGLSARLNDVSFEECVKAIQRTPFVKVFLSLGFETVTECYHSAIRGYVSIRLTK